MSYDLSLGKLKIIHVALQCNLSVEPNISELLQDPHETKPYFTEVKIASSNFMSDRFRDFSLVFFPLIESEISEQANRQIATEEPKKDL